MTKDKKTILMIDDDQMLLKLYEMAVQAHDDEFDLLTAENTRVGMSLAAEKQPDIILLDLILGKHSSTSLNELDKANGFNLLLALKGDENTKRIPIVIFSNLDTRKDHDRAKALGAADYIVKAKSTPSSVLQQIRDVMELDAAAWRIHDAANNK